MKHYYWILIVMLLLVACGTPATPTAPVDSPLGTPARGDSPLSPPDSPAQQRAVDALTPLVAAQLGIAPEALRIVEMEQVTWSDASLGCPQPDHMYADVLTPGWHVVYEDAEGHSYNVHTGEDLENFVICDVPAPDSRAPEAEPGQGNPAVEAALNLLIRTLDAPRDELEVLSSEAREWPDTCLGCPGVEEMCAMVITPGYRIEIMYEGIEHVVHTDATGRSARLCGTLR